jgi:hemolysin activation/secretion protein
MRLCHLVIVTSLCASAALGQTGRDAGSIARDLTTATPRDVGRANEIAAPTVTGAVEPPTLSDGLMVGAVKIDGAPSLPREAFAPAIADYLGKQASTQDLQQLAKAVASVARERGYVFATAVVPPQTVDAGMVTVRIDEGDIALVRVTGSRSARLQRTLDPIVGRGVRREVLERQLLLAGDLPGIEVVSTKLVREDIGNVLVVDVRHSRGNGSAGIDNYGSRDLGPVRARLRYDFAGLVDDGDVLSVQAVATPLDPRQLAYLSVRYAATLGTGGTQVAVTGALGRAEPSNSGIRSMSTFVSVSVSTPLLRGNAASVWANAELGVLRVDGIINGVPDQRDSMAVASGWLYATTRTGGGRLSGALGLTRGLGLAGTTGPDDPRESRLDASGVFTKGYFWADWVQPLGHGFAVKLAASGQLADRPLLAAQEIGLGGPSFGRAFDFSERFGDSGFMASGELRWRKSKPVAWIDWIEPYAFADAGRVWNLDGGYGGGSLTSAGGGVRATLGRLQFSVEAAVPVTSPRAATGNKQPRVNVSIGRRF